MKNLRMVCLFVMCSHVVAAQVIEYRFPSREGSNRSSVFYSSLVGDEGKITLLGTDSLRHGEYDIENYGVTFLAQLDNQGQILKTEYVSPTFFYYNVISHNLQPTNKGFVFSATVSDDYISHNLQLGFRDSLWRSIKDTIIFTSFSYLDIYGNYVQGTDQIICLFDELAYRDLLHRYDMNGNFIRSTVLLVEPEFSWQKVFRTIDMRSYFVFKDKYSSFLDVFDSKDSLLNSHQVNNLASLALVKKEGNNVNLYLLSDSLVGGRQELALVSMVNGLIPSEKLVLGGLDPTSKLIEAVQNFDNTYSCVSKILKNTEYGTREKDSLFVFSKMDSLGTAVSKKVVQLESDSNITLSTGEMIYMSGVVYNPGSNISKIIMNKYSLEGDAVNQSVFYRPGKIELREFRLQSNGLLTLVGKQDKDGWFLGVQQEALGIYDYYVDSKLPTAYPNPVTDYVSIAGVNDGELIEIYDDGGRLMDRQRSVNSSVQIASFPAGIYFIRVPKSHVSYKILKSK